MGLHTDDESEKLVFEQLLGHQAPFTQDECATLTGLLRIEQAKNLNLVQYCSSLESLEFFACDLKSLDFLRNLNNLSTLKLLCCTIEDTGDIGQCQKLEHLELVYTFVEDLEPLLTLPALKTGSLLGNPWTPESYNVFRPRLLSTPSQKWQKPPKIEFSNEEDWKFTRELRERGIQACFSIFDGHYCLVRPGIPKVVNADCDFLRDLPRDFAKSRLSGPDATLDALFDFFTGNRQSDSPWLSFEFQRHRQVGNSDDATKWVKASKLPKETKASLLRLVERFPSVPFAKKDALFWEQWEVKQNVKLPKWLRSILEVLSDIAPDVPRSVRFDNFDHWSSHTDRLGEIWYQLALVGLNSEQQYVADINHLYPIAQWLETGYSTLAVNLANPQDTKIYEYNEHNISYSKGLLDSPRVVFDSYASMLNHIVAVRVKDKIIKTKD